MKKVRYAFGAIGVAPMVAVALPSAATAAETHAPKTVSMQPLSQVTPQVGCTGHVNWDHVFAGFEYGFYYTRNGSHTCIGTVYMRDSVRADTKWRLRIYSGPNHAQRVNTSPAKSHSNYGVHKSLVDPVQLCWATFEGNTLDFGPSCHTVG